jgi:hypothetical protein
MVYVLPDLDLQMKHLCAYPKQQQLSLLSQASWGRLEMKPTEIKNKKHKKGTSQRKS